MLLRCGERLVQLRDAQGKTLREIADELGCSKQNINRLELGSSDSSLGLFVRIAKLYGVSLDFLVSEPEKNTFEQKKASRIIRLCTAERKLHEACDLLGEEIADISGD